MAGEGQQSSGAIMSWWDWQHLFRIFGRVHILDSFLVDAAVAPFEGSIEEYHALLFAG
jgi:hypothetical protein